MYVCYQFPQKNQELKNSTFLYILSLIYDWALKPSAWKSEKRNVLNIFTLLRQWVTIIELFFIKFVMRFLENMNRGIIFVLLWLTNFWNDTGTIQIIKKFNQGSKMTFTRPLKTHQKTNSSFVWYHLFLLFGSRSSFINKNIVRSPFTKYMPFWVVFRVKYVYSANW